MKSLFYWYRNALPKGCRSVGCWALLGWPLRQKVAPGDAVLYQPFCSCSSIILPWFFEPCRLIPAVLRASTTYHQCLPYKRIYLLARFRMCLKIDAAREEQLFCIWRSDGERRGDLSKVQKPWLRTTVDGGGFWRSWRRVSLPPLDFIEGIKTRRQQLR